MKKQIKEYSVEYYRERYRTKEGQEGITFHIKVRLGCTDPVTGKVNDGDIVYYSGRKAFEIKEKTFYETLDGSVWESKTAWRASFGKDTNAPSYKKDQTSNTCNIKNNQCKPIKKAVLYISPNIYMFNATNMQNNKDTIKNAIIKSRKAMAEYFNITWDKITLVPSNYYNKADGIEQAKYENEYQRIFKNLSIRLTEYAKKGYFKGFNERTFLNAEHIKEIINTFKKNKSTNNKYTIKVDFNHNLDVDKMIEKRVDLEYIFLTCCFFDESNSKTNLFKDFNKVFNIKGNYNVNSSSFLEDFETNIKKAIEDYNELTRIDIEKNYQHYFMTCSYLKEKLCFNDQDTFYPFEEEYYTKEDNGKSDDSGRIDNIFIKINEKENTGEVYLIELKVNESVIAGTNGVHKHLQDIKELCSNHKTYEQFMERLKERVNYRRKKLDNITNEIHISPKINFLIVTAIMDGIDHAKKVRQLLYEDFEEEAWVKQAIEKKYLPKNSKKLSLERQELEKLDKIKSVQFFFDKWTKDKMLTRDKFMNEDRFKEWVSNE